MTAPLILPYAAAVLKLLQGVVYQEDKQWELLLTYQADLLNHFRNIGLRLMVDEAEGFAYLSQPSHVEEETSLPRLVRQRPLTFDATLLCVLLRESLQQFDANQPQATRHLLSGSQIQEMMSTFLPQQNDMQRTVRQTQRAITQVQKLGFLRKLPSAMGEEQYEVRSVLKAKISADDLADLRQRLAAHVEGDDEEE